jgi:hypothetical protein
MYVYHPLSRDASGSTMMRAKAVVAMTFLPPIKSAAQPELGAATISRYSQESHTQICLIATFMNLDCFGFQTGLKI